MSSWTSEMQLGPYVLLAPLGAGGMGEVWKARDSRLERVVAVKRLKGQYSERFQQEARALAALNHPNICQVYDVGPDYLVLEYVEGRRLPCPLALEEAVRLAIEIAGAIEAAHRKGIIHRDLKPDNIMLTERRSVKLLDFGLAKLVARADSDDTRTIEGIVTGTAAYMAPEQAEGKALDERSDVFSFGAVLYEMLAGGRAFCGGSTAQVLSAVLHDEPRPLDAPAAVERIVKRCLAKQPGQRFQSMADVRVALEQLAAEPAARQPSIAVLPFSTLSGDKENEYFSDGLAEEIINALAQIPGLNVTARTSSFAFRGKEQDIRKIAETLGVRTILEGSVRRAGSRIRVTAQLIDAGSGYHLWSERYDRELEDIFAIQDEIAQAIAIALKVKLAAQPAALRRHTPSLPAYESLLKARHLVRRLTPAPTSRAKECLEQAIALDPEFALAQAELGMYFIYLASLSLMPAREALPLARAAAQKALILDPALPEARAALALVAVFLEHDWEEGGRQFELARARAPVPPGVRHLYGIYYLLPLGRIEEAIEELEGALKEDPLNLLCRTQFAVCLRAAGRLEEASRQLRQVLELDEDSPLALMLQSVSYSGQGRLEEALVLAERACAVAGNAEGVGVLAGVLGRVGDTKRSEALLRELGDGTAYGTPIGFLIFHLVQSETEKAADWAERAIEERHPNILPAACSNRKFFVSAGRWPALARLLNLPGTASGQSV